MRFEVEDIVYILYRNPDQNAGWADDMDETVGKSGIIIELEEDNDNYLIRFPNGKKYYYAENCVGDKGDLDKVDQENNVDNNMWFMASISGEIFKKIGRDDDDRFNIYVNKNGHLVSDQYFILYCAPPTCTSFDWKE